jgi:hypothetical protein
MTITESHFEAALSKSPAGIRDEVRDMAWGNSWSAECYEASKTDAERWAECVLMAEMIIDAPSDYGIN